MDPEEFLDKLAGINTPEPDDILVMIGALLPIVPDDEFAKLYSVVMTEWARRNPVGPVGG